MNNDIPIFQDPQSRNRTKQQYSEISGPNGTICLTQKHNTEITGQGNVITTINDNAMILSNGEKISNLSKVAGQCQNDKCGHFVTEKSIRFCFYCGDVICAKCIKWDKKELKWLCKKCNRSIKWKRFGLFMVKMIISPFLLIRWLYNGNKR